MTDPKLSLDAKQQSLNLKRLPKAILAATAALAGLQATPTMAVLEETLVTATRRTATDIQTTPIAVTAMTSRDIEELVPRDLGDLAAQVPNFIAGKQPGFLPSGSGPDFQNHILCVVGIFWNQQQLEFIFQGFLF